VVCRGFFHGSESLPRAATTIFPSSFAVIRVFSDSESQFMAATVFFPKLYLKKLIYKKLILIPF
jgi:hypothetical protein